DRREGRIQGSARGRVASVKSRTESREFPRRCKSVDRAITALLRSHPSQMKLVPAPNPHILLVDDNCDGLLVRRALLEEAGCTVELAHNGDEGLELFIIGKFDLVVTDFRMPGMDGVEFIKHVRTADPSARVILLSGFVEPLGLNEENTGAD